MEEIEQDLLELLKNSKGFLNTDDLATYRAQNDLEWADVWGAHISLISEGLIAWTDSHTYSYILTGPGKKASRLGLKEYRRIEDNKTNHSTTVINTGIIGGSLTNNSTLSNAHLVSKIESENINQNTTKSNHVINSSKSETSESRKEKIVMILISAILGALAAIYVPQVLQYFNLLP